MTPLNIHRALAIAALILAVPACGDRPRGAGADELARSTFIDTYVDLRVAALRSEEGQITDSARAEILQRHGVTEKDLVDFVTETAENFDFTRDLWNEIELRLDSVPPLPRDGVPPDSAGGPPSSDTTRSDP